MPQPAKFTKVGEGGKYYERLNKVAMSPDNISLLAIARPSKQTVDEAKDARKSLVKFFNKAKVKSFKNIKINLKNEKILKGKSRLIMKEFADANLIMWWNIDLSGEKPVGEIEIEISGKGPQIKLRTNN